MEFKEFLKTQLLGRLTIAKFAKEMGKSRETVYRWMNGTQGINETDRAKALKIFRKYNDKLNVTPNG